MHRAVGVARVLLALTLVMVVMIFDRFEMARALVFCASGVIEAHIECPLVGLGGVGDKVRDGKAAERGAQVVGRPRTDAEAVRAIGGVWRIDEEAIQTRKSFMPCLGHNKGISHANHMLQLRLGESEV